MTPSFGRRFRRRGVEFLLVGGQATVLYGAAAFSEDIDLWVNPTTANLNRLRLALRDLGTRLYKLTPPLTVRNARKGHGFHFLIPSRPSPIYLDVMGQPPRVGSFRACMRRSRILSTAMGLVPVLGMEDLVEIKKTRRLGDYEVISALVRIRVREGGANPSSALLRWALLNSFSAEDLEEIIAAHPGAVAIARRLQRPALRHLRNLDACRRMIAAEIAEYQRRDMIYWTPVLRELRELRARGELLPEGDRLI